MKKTILAYTCIQLTKYDNNLTTRSVNPMSANIWHQGGTYASD